MGLDLAGVAESWVQAPINVVTGQHKVIKFTVGSGAAHAYGDDPAIGLQDKIVSCRGRIAKRRLHAAAVTKGLVKATVGIETSDEKSCSAGRARSHYLAIRLKDERVQVVAVRVKHDNYLAARAEGRVKASIPVVAHQGRMEVWIDSALPGDNNFPIRLHPYGKGIIVGLGEVGLHEAAVAKSRIEVTGRGLS